jgi:hypothetical protein
MTKTTSIAPRISGLSSLSNSMVPRLLWTCEPSVHLRLETDNPRDKRPFSLADATCNTWSELEDGDFGSRSGAQSLSQCWDRLGRFLSIARGRVLEGSSNGSQGYRPTLVFQCRRSSRRRRRGPTDSLVIARSVLLSMHVRVLVCG